ncbi:AMP-binding protein [Aureispira anguillae]|uniref:AMP-binding protein n=1 Tax=Aureispira anguillae TaxID=2864201 RepID=A0A915YAX0_9BACT|nr:AMP-binding protein [Aureispira anguillae]BDS09405.1 AMP-binding protein [Aureispira anguillae]
MFQTFQKLYQANISTPVGIYRLLRSIIGTGTNLMALLEFAARSYPSETAIIDDYQSISYQDLYKETQQLAVNLKEKHAIHPHKKVALLCRNHSPLVKSLFALSCLGADAYLLNIEMTSAQFNDLLDEHNFDCVIYDLEVWEMVHRSNFDKKTLLSQHITFDSIQGLSTETPTKKINLKKSSAGKLIILTGGTTGAFKTAVRKPAVSNFLNPFFALLNQLNLGTYQSAYIATPIYHGFGMAALLVSLTLGVKIVLTKRFKAQKTTSLLLKHRVQVLILVPLILDRLLQQSKLELIYTRLIISGGAPLNPNLVQRTFKLLKHDLANLYGTSEAGFCIMATTEDLKLHANTIGKKIRGVQLKLLDNNQQEVAIGTVGALSVRSSWGMKNTTDSWIPTGDLAYQNEQGYYFLCGRVDDRIVSGGENVYPVELEHILLQHDAIQQTAVIGISDPEFGQRLKAFVVLKPQQVLDQSNLQEWLKDHAARHQMPKEIVFIDHIPVTALGKTNKKKLF